MTCVLVAVAKSIKCAAERIYRKVVIQVVELDQFRFVLGNYKTPLAEVRDSL